MQTNCIKYFTLLKLVMIIQWHFSALQTITSCKIIVK